MKLSIDLACDSSPEWVQTVMNDFDSFLQDHANCERKASNMALSLIAKYPDRLEIIPELIETAVEELEHFRDVYAVMQERGLPLAKELTPDVYVNQLLTLLRTSSMERFMDRLLLGSVIECRGAERFKLVWEALPDGELKKFYHRLWASEAKHGNIFVKMALNYFDETTVYKRLNELMKAEAVILQSLPLKAALH
ncbi:tRNA-(ms[2]io[6]A)-hydroxylase [Oscillatoria amoena NRMC-F 0135]|nr:tRNA-(ms[2]io[6]A)-hydroxylase [Oscillatoria amoena NRMC-F 0135]